MSDKGYSALLGPLLRNTPLALDVVGVLLFAFAAAGGLPQFQIFVADPVWRIALAVLSLAVVAMGGFQLWAWKAPAAIDPEKYGVRITYPTAGSEIGTTDVIGTIIADVPSEYSLIIL